VIKLVSALSIIVNKKRFQLPSHEIEDTDIVFVMDYHSRILLSLSGVFLRYRVM
jgi:hypothetical protein